MIHHVGAIVNPRPRTERLLVVSRDDEVFQRPSNLAAIGRYDSGLPYSRTNPAGDTLIGLPNSWRLPSERSLDLLVRQPLRVWGWRGGLYLDVRNLFNWRNVVAVRRDTGTPGAGDPQIQAMALAAYNAHPEAIPYESPRYRRWADGD